MRARISNITTIILLLAFATLWASCQKNSLYADEPYYSIEYCLISSNDTSYVSSTEYECRSFPGAGNVDPIFDLSDSDSSERWVFFWCTRFPIEIAIGIDGASFIENKVYTEKDCFGPGIMDCGRVMDSYSFSFILDDNPDRWQRYYLKFEGIISEEGYLLNGLLSVGRNLGLANPGRPGYNYSKYIIHEH